MVRLLLLALLVFPMLARAAPIVAWKAPIELIAPDYRTDEKVRKLEKPPQESVFFKPGDELWDVSSLLENASLLPYGYFEAHLHEGNAEMGPWKGKWAVWNARSGRLVACGSPRDLLKAQLAWDFEEEPAKIRCHFDWMRPGAKQPYQSFTLVCGNGETGKGNEGGISIRVDPSVEFRGEEVVYVSFAVSWNQEAAEAGWEFGSSSLYLKPGRKVLVAKHGSGETGWELYLNCREEAADGTEARLLESKNGGLQNWSGSTPLSRLFPEKVRLEGGRSIVWYQLAPDFGSAPFPLPKPDLEVPEHLRPWIDGPWTNCAHLLAKQGIVIEETGLAGIEPFMHQLVVVGSAETQGAVAKLVDQMSAGPDIPLFIETNPGAGNSGLMVGSGNKASISRSKGDETETIFGVEAIRGDETIDLSLEMQIPGEKGKDGFLRTGITLPPDRWIKVAEVKSREAMEVSIRAGDPPP